MSRRSFLKTGTTAAIGLSMVPGAIFGAKKDSKKKKAAKKDKIKLLGVGIGGRGASVLRGLVKTGKVEIIGLCDVDWKYAGHVFEEHEKNFPNLKRYNDYKKMYAELLDQADAVMCATADHTHAIICAEAIAAGKHVYCEKPLTHTVYESRLLTKLAAKHRVATQMGNQGASGEGVRKICNWIWNGEIGEIKKVETFTDRPIWPQGLERPEETPAVPSTLNWDAFIGPAPMRPYNPIYTPWNFRGWWDFGTGALGDMACHILHPVFKALNLKYPTKVQGTSTLLLSESCPNAEYIKYTFPARDNMPKVAMPEVEVYWYDGGLMPERPVQLPNGKNLNVSGGAAIFYGTKDILICGCYGVDPYLLSGRNPEVPNLCREVENNDHQADWVRACLEDPDERIPSESDFQFAGPFNEMVVMGVNAVRLQGLNQELEWDGEKMEFTNIPADAVVKSVIKDGFSIKDGHPTFNKTWTEPVNARKFAAELVRHTYREGWVLPEMPE
ncbi:MAG: Gfo/Idh/MocA family oxidoreductase [Muribaculaceae bacterium]|nr:Gfo/Idh/MocA family oxidoreductase [Muribaculaceae bacterium]MDY3933126.1 Gfo/Idh/MocA family oxidoreductase [Muribaculaceae bacterium]